MYAASAEHPLRKVCEDVLVAVADRTLDGVVSTEVIQEILHRFTHIGRRQRGAMLARANLDLFSPVLPITHDIMARAPDLLQRYPKLSSRDAVHAATCQQLGIGAILTPDRGFDAVKEIRRVDPGDADAIRSLLTR